MAPKATPAEIANCSTHVAREIATLDHVKVVLVLGKIAFDAYLNHLKRTGVLASKAGLAFGHGELYKLPNGIKLLCSYHPSLQNTNTGRLTESMMVEILRRARKLIG